MSGAALGFERLDVLSARDGCSIFNVTAAFVELSTDKIDLFEDPFSSA